MMSSAELPVPSIQVRGFNFMFEKKRSYILHHSTFFKSLKIIFLWKIRNKWKLIFFLEYSNFPWLKRNTKPAGDAILPPLTTNRRAPSKPKRKRKTKRSVCIISFFQLKWKKPKSEKKLKLRDRIMTFINNDSMKNIRKRFRSLWTPKKAADKKLTQPKTTELKMFVI